MATDNTNEVTLWIQQLDQETLDAFEKIWQHFYRRLVEFSGAKLKAAPRKEADEEDVAVSAMHSLYNGIQAGRFPILRNRDDLWKILLTIAGAKAKKQIRRLMAQKRGGGSVRGESIFMMSNEQAGDGLANLPGIEPTPEFAELVSVECEERLKQLEDDVLSRVAVLKLQGFSNDEIALEIPCAVRTVERKLTRIRAIWSEE